MDFLNLNLDKTLSGNSNTTISSQKALKSYIDAKRILLNFLQDQPPTTYNTGDKWLNTSTKKLYIATSSSNWGNPIDLNIDQVYSFENLFYHYDGTDILNYSTESITEQNNNYEIKTWFGTQNEYDALDNYDANTLYNIVDNASILSSLLATQTEFNNSVSNKAATPYQVNQALGNYLPLAGGNLDAGAVLRLTNTNNNTVSLAYNTSNYLTISNNLSVSGNITTNSLIASTGNIYNGSATGPKVIWNNNYATSSTAGIIKPDNTTLTVDNTGTLTVIGGSGGGGSVILLQFLQSTTPTTYSANDKWLNISDYKLYTATSSSTWDSGESITEDQIFGFNNLLYHYDGTNLIIYSTESVKNQNDGVEIKTWVGTQDEYDSISTYDNNTIYNIVNSDTSITNQYHPPLLSFKWSEHKFNSLSWLRADTFSWQNGNVYKAAYQHIVNDLILNVENLYCWSKPLGDVREVYTIDENPSVGDNVYVIDNGFAVFYDTIIRITTTGITTRQPIYNYERYSDGDLTSQKVITVPAQTETIGDYTIIYFEVDDEHKIVFADQETAVMNIYNATGDAKYFILDTTNTRFKLPRWKHNKYQAKAPVIGTGIALGFTNGQENFGTMAGGAGLDTYQGDYGKAIGTAYSGTRTTSGKVCGIVTDPIKSGIEATLDTDDMYLYFYVGNFSQSAIEQTAGLNSELLNSKVDTSSLQEVQCIVETYSSGTDWYRIWSDGWCEQGGQVTSLGTGASTNTVTFLKPFTDTNYTLTFAAFGNGFNSGEANFRCTAYTSTTCTFYNNSGTVTTYKWYACGYIS